MIGRKDSVGRSVGWSIVCHQARSYLWVRKNSAAFSPAENVDGEMMDELPSKSLFSHELTRQKCDGDADVDRKGQPRSFRRPRAIFTRKYERSQLMKPAKPSGPKKGKRNDGFGLRNQKTFYSGHRSEISN